MSDLVIAHPVWESGAIMAYIRWAGAYLELKMPGRQPTKEQDDWLELMEGASYFTAVVRSEDEFAVQVGQFLLGKEPVDFARRGKKK